MVEAGDPAGGGKQLGDYLVAGEVARGGQGVVLDARHGPSGRRVALKLLLDPEPSAALRFGQEARILATFCHPNLLRVTDLGDWQGRPFMAMEFVEGETLQARVARGGPPPLEWVGRVLVTVAHALEHCHARGVVHRDLKPANVLVEADSERPVLVDFGLVKRDPSKLALSSIDGEGKLSKTGELRGTPQYMAPEQASPGRFGEVDARSDVYALGATLFFLLTGRPPFEGSSLVSLVKQVIGEPPPDPARERPGIPPALARFCRRCLAKDRADRPASARAFAEELAALLAVDDAPSFASAAPGAAPPRPLLKEPPPGCPRMLGAYVVEGLLGQGGMGSVLVGRHHVLGVTRAVKVLDVGGGNPRAIGRFAREVDHLAQVRHTNVVAIHDAGQVGRWSYYAMDLLEGEPLDALMARGPVPYEQALRLTRGIARGVAALHAAGVIHRDLKPQNVVVRAEDGQPVVIDLGLAIAPELDERLTRTGALVGTPLYMAPEQVRGAPPDPRSDVYALGLILYELVTGRRVVGPADTPHEVLARILGEEAPPPSSVFDELPRELDAACARLLAKDPARRPANAAEVARELTQLLGASSGPPRRRPRAPLVIGALAALALGGVAATLRAAPERPAPTPDDVAADAEVPPPPRDERPRARELSPQEREEAEHEARALRREPDPRQRWERATAWLAAYPGHPATADVEALREEASYLFATRSWPGMRGGVFLGEGELVLWSRAGEVTRRAVADDAVQGRWQIARSAEALALTPDRRGLLLAGGGRVWRSALADGAIDEDWASEREGAQAVALSPSEPLVALASGREGEGASVLELRDLASGTVRRTLWRGEDYVTSLAFDPSGRWLAFATGASIVATARDSRAPDNAVRVADVATGETRRLPTSGRPNVIAIPPSGAALAVATTTGQVQLVDPEAAVVVRDLRAEGGTFNSFVSGAMGGSIKGLAYVAGGRRLVSVMPRRENGEVGRVAVWDVASGERLWEGRNLPNFTRAEVSPEGGWLLLPTEDGVELWRCWSAPEPGHATGGARSD